MKKKIIFPSIYSQILNQSVGNLNSKQNQCQNSNLIDIAFQNISYTVKVQDLKRKSNIPYQKYYKNKVILNNVSGIFKAKKISVIMGASGAGKTSLLNILACRSKCDKNGKIYANNLEYNQQNFGYFANYVTQQDILMSTLTVRQTLQFAVKLKLNVTQSSRKKIINDIVKNLKLQKCLDTLVGGFLIKGISGGQRKRTSIAVQLISDPQVLFLDEPTSGLDSLTSYIIVDYLRQLSHYKNKTIIMTIHQPNSQIFSLFDNLTLMSNHRIIYQGQRQTVRRYFNQKFNLLCPPFSNIPDYLMYKIHYQQLQKQQQQSQQQKIQRINKKRKHQQFLGKYNDQQYRIKHQILIRQKYTPEFRQTNLNLLYILWILINRNILNYKRNPLLIKSKIIQGIIISLFNGGMYFNIGNQNYLDPTVWITIKGFLFSATIGFYLASLTPIVLTFPLQRQIYLKEKESKFYSMNQYFLARNIVEIPQTILIPLIWIVIYYFMIDLSLTIQQFFFHYLIAILLSFCGNSMGLIIGSVIFDAKSAASAVAITVSPFIIFSGFFKNRVDMASWYRWIQYFSPNKYGFVAFIQNQIKYKDLYINDLNFQITKWQATILLLLLGIFFKIVSFIFLSRLKLRTN